MYMQLVLQFISMYNLYKDPAVLTIVYDYMLYKVKCLMLKHIYRTVIYAVTMFIVAYGFQSTNTLIIKLL